MEILEENEGELPRKRRVKGSFEFLGFRVEGEERNLVIFGGFGRERVARSRVTRLERKPPR